MLLEAGTGGAHADTLLLVLGDHGMTTNGQHGGGSPDETHTALFALSMRRLHQQRQDSCSHTSVMLGPFSHCTSWTIASSHLCGPLKLSASNELMQWRPSCGHASKHVAGY